ncbi:MAG: hypothetical protein AAF653_17605 [Chloroflexota bacterium]
MPSNMDDVLLSQLQDIPSQEFRSRYESLRWLIDLVRSEMDRNADDLATMIYSDAQHMERDE